MGMLVDGDDDENDTLDGDGDDDIHLLVRQVNQHTQSQVVEMFSRQQLIQRRRSVG